MSSYVVIARVAVAGLMTGLLAGWASGAAAQDRDPLGGYIREALQENAGLRQQRLMLEGRESSVRQARGLFMPSVSVDARYSDMQGGLDLGELVNPAYRALNQLTGSQQFPTNIDGRFPFAQETRMRVVQPVFNASVLTNYRVNTRLRDQQVARMRAAARQLAADVQGAYVDHARAARLADVYRSTLVLVQANLRVSQRLLVNGKVTADVVHRAEAERLEVEQQLAEAEQKSAASRGRLNLLLNRALDAEVDLVADSMLVAPVEVTVEEAVARGRRAREELMQLAAGVEVAEAQKRLARASYLPSVSLALDYGVQGNEYRLNRESDFAVVSVVATWNVFNGMQDAARAEQASLEAARTRMQQEDVERQIELQARTAWAAAKVGEKAVAAAQARAEAARRSYELVSRRYEEGMASPLELLDARTAHTNAELNRVLTVHEFFARRVELERAAALRDLDADLRVER